MMNPFHDVNWRPGVVERKKFARSLVIGFPIIATVLLFIGRFQTHTWKPFPIWLGVVGAGLGIIFWLLPQIARPFYVAWYFVGCCFGFVVGNVLLSAFYFLVLTPIGFFLRAIGRKPLRKS